jgi:hypothetical protein
VVQVSFRHRFGAVPAALLGGRHGRISGHVFRDDDIGRRYSEVESGMEGIEVRLDDTTSTRTDSNGYYEFHRVPYGLHTVQARITDPRPYFFTTDSPATTAIDTIVDIGVSFVRGKIFGYVRSDAGTGIPSIDLLLSGAGNSRRIQTAFDGKFSMDGVPDGEYLISTVPESFPDGYNLINLPVQTLTVKADRPNPVILVVRALRTVSGRVTALVAATANIGPVEEAAVSIPELGLATKTDKNGKFLFRDLPLGSYSVKVGYNGGVFSRLLELPAEPVIVANFDFSVK